MSTVNRVSIWDDDIDFVGNTPEPPEQSVWKPFFVGFLISVMTGAIAIAAIVTLWVLSTNSQTSVANITTSMSTTSTTITTRTTSTSTSTTTSTSTSTTSSTTICSTTAITTTVTSSSLPSQCTSYTLITDGTRAGSYTGSSSCDTTTFSSATWVRFSSPAGTLLASCVVAVNSCDTQATGWYSGLYPSAAGGTTAGAVCYNWAGNTCSWTNSISITNCNGYYVFLLSAPPACSLRYCTI